MPSQTNNDVAKVLGAVAGKVTDWERKQYRRAVAEKLRRECEALRLYEPQAFQQAFHSSTVRKLVMQKANQVGGTLAGAVEVARAVTGQDPFNKYPKRDGVVACLGYGESHIGTVFYPKLFRAGAFDIIRDRETNKWRTYRPWPEASGGDLERADQRKMAPPLIPQRFIEGRPSWVKRGENIFKVVRFVNGWELRAYNSAGDAGQAQGFQADLYWVDEDVATVGWVVEILFRLMKRRGLLRWTAVPHAKNDEMMRLIEDAEKQAEKAEPTTKVLRVTAFDNKFMGRAELDEAIDAAKAQGDDVYRQRILGDLNLGSALMYPTFSRNVHDVMNVPTLEDDQKELKQNDGRIPDSWSAQRILAARMGEPPDDWTRYVSVDPGATVLAIEFLAVPPPHLGNQIFLYDECYLRDPPVPTEAFGDAMHLKCADRVIEAVIFDMHGGRLRSIATGEVPVNQYSKALESRGVRAMATGFGFRHACDDRSQREEMLRKLLSIQRNGQPRFMVVAGKCSSFCWEIERFRKKVVKQWGKEVTVDEGDRRVNTHAIEAVEGAIALDMPYIKPKTKHADYSVVDRVRAYMDRLRAKRNAQGIYQDHHISLGPQGVSS